MNVTIHDVARESGVSISTVSKVMNGSTRISEATAIRIRETMKRLDYHPNSIARAFVQQSSGTVGVLMEMGKYSAFLNPYLYEILGGIEKVLHQNGFLLSVSNILDSKDTRNLLEKMTRVKRVDGYVLHASAISRDIVGFLEENHVPHVVIGELEEKGSLCWVDADNDAAGNLAARHLIEAGRRRIAFLGGPRNDGISSRRYRGFQEALKSAGYPLSDALCARIDISFDSAHAAMKEFLGLPGERRPDAIVCVSNFAAAGAMRAIKDSGLAIPRDIAVVGFDDYPLAPYLDPPLTVVNLDLHELGTHAGRAIMFKIKNPDTQVSFRMLEPTLTKRESA